MTVEPTRPTSECIPAQKPDHTYALPFPPELVNAIAEAVAVIVLDRMPKPREEWLDVDAAAAYLSAPKSRVYDLIAQEAIETVRDGRRVLTRASWLDAYLGGEKP